MFIKLCAGLGSRMTNVVALRIPGVNEHSRIPRHRDGYAVPSAARHSSYGDCQPCY